MAELNMKLRAFANYILDHNNCESQTKLHILLYYCQAWHLAEQGTPAFDAEFIAEADGPKCPALDELLCVWPRVNV